MTVIATLKISALELAHIGQSRPELAKSLSCALTVVRSPMLHPAASMLSLSNSYAP